MDRPGTPFLILVAGALLIAGPAHSAGASGMTLTQGWAIQSSADVREGGAAVSTVGYKVEDWYPTTVPSTVLAALVAQHVYPDPFPGMNLRSIAGTHNVKDARKTATGVEVNGWNVNMKEVRP